MAGAETSLFLQDVGILYWKRQHGVFPMQHAFMITACYIKICLKKSGFDLMQQLHNYRAMDLLSYIHDNFGLLYDCGDVTAEYITFQGN